MTDSNQYPATTAFHAHSAAPQPPKQKWWKKPIVLVGAGCLILGGVLGGSGKKTEYVDVPGPERVVEKEVKVELTVEKTPRACIDALALAQQGFEYSSESMGYMNDALQAAGRFDVRALEQANRDLSTVTPKIEALQAPMLKASTDCRGKQ